jgi:hypothetical protein
MLDRSTFAQVLENRKIAAPRLYGQHRPCSEPKTQVGEITAIATIHNLALAK